MSTLRAGQGPKVRVEAIERYLRRRFGGQAEVLGVGELGQSTQESLKDYGYGRPLRVDFRVAAGGTAQTMVIRTMSPDPFGHDRRADRVGAMVLDFDVFPTMPRHIQPHEVGVFDAAGELVPMPAGEAWLVTDYVDGELYARDLKVLQGVAKAGARDLARAEALADYLAALHVVAGPPEAWWRAIRDTIGSGEGIFGLCDSYPAGHPIARPERLMRIEQAAIAWRWRWRAEGEPLALRRSRRTHGDFHPFNLLFREGVDFTALDCSRGAVGEPADDVACLSLNYLFFSLAGGAERFEGALRELWEVFWARYLDKSGDLEILSRVAPFFAWRGLVVASPVWYPKVPDAVRERLFLFIERLLAGEPFMPSRVDELLR